MMMVMIMMIMIFYNNDDGNDFYDDDGDNDFRVMTKEGREAENLVICKESQILHLPPMPPKVMIINLSDFVKDISQGAQSQHLHDVA